MTRARRGSAAKRHILTDTLGLLVGLVVHGADVQDRDGAPDVLKTIRRRFPWLRHVFADAGYAGPKPPGALDKIGDWRLETVKRTDTGQGGRRFAATLGRRTHLRLARAMAQSGQGLGKIHRIGRGLAPRRAYPPRNKASRKASLYQVEF